MKRFIINTFLLFLIFFGICVFISMQLPYHWGNPWYNVKVEYLEDNPNLDYNTYFFGSSKVFHQIDPLLFDSIAYELTKEKFRSFNLGTPGTFAPQSYYLYEKFLESDLSNGVKYCFLEISDLTVANKKHIHQGKSNYWINQTNIKSSLNSIYNDQSIDRIDKFLRVKRHLASYVNNIFHLGHFSSRWLNDDLYNLQYIGPAKNGYLPYEVELETTTNPIIKKALTTRRKQLFERSDVLDQFKKKTYEAIHNPSHNFFDSINLQKIVELQELSEEKGIQLILLLSRLRPKKDYDKIINLSKQIPASEIINLSNPSDYPQLFVEENLFALGHLNTKGAIFFTSTIAEEFQKIKK